MVVLVVVIVVGGGRGRGRGGRGQDGVSRGEWDGPAFVVQDRGEGHPHVFYLSAGGAGVLIVEEFVEVVQGERKTEDEVIKREIERRKVKGHVKGQDPGLVGGGQPRMKMT